MNHTNADVNNRGIIGAGEGYKRIPHFLINFSVNLKQLFFKVYELEKIKMKCKKIKL